MAHHDPGHTISNPPAELGAGGPRKPRSDGDVHVVGADAEDEPTDLSYRHELYRASPQRDILPVTSGLRRLVSPLGNHPPTSNDSVAMNTGDEHSSFHFHSRSISEGDAVTHELQEFRIQDPRSPSPAVPTGISPTRPNPRKRRSKHQLPEGHARTRSGPIRGEDPGGAHAYGSRPLTPQTNPSPSASRQYLLPPALSPSKQLVQPSSADVSTSPTDLRPQVDRVSSDEGLKELLKQPTTRAITQEQLINEVKGIYQGLVMVEKKCVEIDQQQSLSTKSLTNEQYQALIALHRTLLHEHHDFFLASQHPSASNTLRKLATKYAMAARMWRHAIHSFLELLRHRLPESLEHMLAFVYLAYSMMALLMESVPSFEETWIECLGDLARYRMAIEESDQRDRETWSSVARMWYNRAADRSPGVGRIQHHLAVLARPNIVQQLFYYTKSLISVVPFHNARESVMLLFNQFLEPREMASQRHPMVEALFVKAAGFLFVRGSIKEFGEYAEQFNEALSSHIGRTTAKFRIQGSEIASALIAFTLDFGHSDAFLVSQFRQHEKKSAQEAPSESPEPSEGPRPHPEDGPTRRDAVRRYWTGYGTRQSTHPATKAPSSQENLQDTGTFPDSTVVYIHASAMMGSTMKVVFSRLGDKNVLSFTHVMLAFLWSSASVPGALDYVQSIVPWEQISVFLNTLGRFGASKADIARFPRSGSIGPQLPEDFVMRGQLWSVYYYPAGFFSEPLLGEDERTLEMPSHAVYRAERCLWLGLQLSSVSEATRGSRHAADSRSSITGCTMTNRRSNSL